MRMETVTKILVVLSLQVLFFSLMPPTNPSTNLAETLPDGLHGEPKFNVPEVSREYTTKTQTISEPKPGDVYRKVNVLVAGDEEMTSTKWQYFGESLHWMTYTKRQIARASSYFYECFRIQLSVEKFATWDSDDSCGAVCPATLEEVRTELGFYSGMIWEGVRIDILIAWTNQYSPLWAGMADLDNSVIIMQPQADWIDDNLVQHEFTHLYGIPNNHFDFEHICVMNQEILFLIYTIEEGQIIYINDWVVIVYGTNDWCAECHQTIKNNRLKYGVETVNRYPNNPHRGSAPSTAVKPMPI